jgi:hypothetical protein
MTPYFEMLTIVIILLILVLWSFVYYIFFTGDLETYIEYMDSVEMEEYNEIEPYDRGL